MLCVLMQKKLERDTGVYFEDDNKVIAICSSERSDKNLSDG